MTTLPPDPILIATPEPLPAELLRSALPEAFPIRWVPDGLAALAEIPGHRPRMIVLAAGLPLLAGWQVCRLLRQEPSLATIPLVLVHVGDVQREELLREETDADLQLTLTSWEELASPVAVMRLQDLLARPPLPPLPEREAARLAAEFAPAQLIPRISAALHETLLERALLRRLAEASAKLHDLALLVPEVFRLSTQVLEFQRAGLYLYDSGALYLQQPSEPEAAAAFRTAMLEQAAIFSPAVDEVPVQTEHALDLASPPPVPPAGASPAFFAVPLMSESGTVGVFGVQTFKSVSRREYYLRTLGLLAQQIALVLASALLYHRVQNLSRTDELTQLPNRRAFFERAREELVRHQRFGKPLSVLLVDLDYFKRVNDVYGHQQGDWVLRDLGQVFRQHLRAIDLPGRIGGEEFAILLPETGPAGAQVVAERVRQAVAAQAFEAVSGNEPLRCTVSIGSATWEGQAIAGIEVVLAAADTALYRSKTSGRNQVQVGSLDPGA